MEQTTENKGIIIFSAVVNIALNLQTKLTLAHDFEMEKHRGEAQQNERKLFVATLAKFLKSYKGTQAYIGLEVFNREKKDWIWNDHIIWFDAKNNQAMQCVRAGENKIVFPSLEKAIEHYIEEYRDLAKELGKDKAVE